MSLSYNGIELQSITYNGADVQTVTYNGVEVWSARPPFLVRMRYDANEASHVKDIAGIFSIASSNGVVPNVADPFGGNNALDLSSLYLMVKGAAAINSNKLTVATWVNLSSSPTKSNVLMAGQPANVWHKQIYFKGLKACTTHDSDLYDSYGGVCTPNALSANVWHFVEISYDNSLVRIFVDGQLKISQTDDRLASVEMKNANQDLFIGTYVWTRNDYLNHLKGHIYDFCILNGIWHTENYNVPTAYI